MVALFVCKNCARDEMLFFRQVSLGEKEAVGKQMPTVGTGTNTSAGMAGCPVMESRPIPLPIISLAFKARAEFGGVGHG